MRVIDADGHVEESLGMFQSIDSDFYERRPIALTFDEDTIYGGFNALWLIDGETFPKIVGKGGSVFMTPTSMALAANKRATIGSQELTNVGDRLRELDEFGTGIQFVFPTLFLAATASDVQLEAALFRCYNDFLGNVVNQSEGRIRFAALVPTREADAGAGELRRAKELGASSVMLHGRPWDVPLGSEKLFPLYEEAERLDMPVTLHRSWGSPSLNSGFVSGDRSASFGASILTVLMGFHSLISYQIPEKFPRLRFAIMEAGAGWVPWVASYLRESAPGTKDPREYFREDRFYIGCGADEDINYLTSQIGEDCLLAFSDYPHFDFSAEENIRSAFLELEHVPLRVREKILGENAARLYRLPS